MDPNNKLLILTETPEHFAALIEARGFDDLECIACHTTEEAFLHVQDCNIILGEPKRIAPLLNGAGNLKWVQSTYAGTEPLMGPAMRSDYLLTNIRGIFGPLMSEYVFAHILALERHLLQARENQKKRRWQEIPYRSLEGICLGICGVGSIGGHIARTAKHFQMEVWGFKRTREHVPGLDRIFAEEEFKEFLAHPDYVVITFPETPDTHHLFDREAFGSMNPSAVLINVGRGAIVSERALIHALKKNQIRGAVLDVFEEEPLPEESLLWELPNLWITSHNAAISFPEPVVEIFVENYQRFKAGEPLQNRVDFKRGY
ncbi:MAG: D-2-hydroxyacid dehydrogenase [Desulfatiglandaceae bacterium]